MYRLYQWQARFFLPLTVAFLIFSAESAQAERKPVKILDLSSSGQTVMITAGTRDGLKLKDPVLIRREDKKLVAARVIKLFEEKSAVYVVARFSRENPLAGSVARKYNILYGVPMDVPELPSGILADTEIVDELERNPQDETFFADDGREKEPEIDDDLYNPETTVKPEFPPVDYRKPHNISIGLGLFRNANLQETLDPELQNNNSSRTYQGYFFRYAYNFRTYYWLGKKIPALISVETSVGFYSFAFDDQSLPNGGKKTEIDVIPLAVYVRYNYEFSLLFLGYGYVGYQINKVGALNNYPIDRLRDLEGGGLAFGLGASLVISKVIDFRFEAGNDGVFTAGVVKF